MDDSKLNSKRNYDDIKGLINSVKRFSVNKRMQFGLHQCVKVIFKKISLVKSKNITVNLNTEITEVEHNETYKYFGMKKANGVSHTTNKDKIRKEFYWVMRLVSKTV